MPTRHQIAAYILGVRFSQAFIISGFDSSLFPSTAELRASIDRLARAFDELARAASIEHSQHERGKNILQDCWQTAMQVSRQSLLENDGFGDCNPQLLVFRQILISSLANEQATLELLQEWLELGIELADGSWDDPIHPITGTRLRDGDARWVPNHEARLDELLDLLAISRADLMREPWEGELDPSLFADVPMAVNWLDIEAGMRDMHLQQEVACEGSSHSRRVRPSWNKSRGELSIGGEVIRTIRYIGKAKNIVRVLDSFEELDWPRRILCPISADRTNDTIRSLNDGLTDIRFHCEPASGTAGGAIFWVPEVH